MAYKHTLIPERKQARRLLRLLSPFTGLKPGAAREQAKALWLQFVNFNALVKAGHKPNLDTELLAISAAQEQEVVCVTKGKV